MHTTCRRACGAHQGIVPSTAATGDTSGHSGAAVAPVPWRAHSNGFTPGATLRDQARTHAVVRHDTIATDQQATAVPIGELHHYSRMTITATRGVCSLLATGTRLRSDSLCVVIHDAMAYEEALRHTCLSMRRTACSTSAWPLRKTRMSPGGLCV